jgi:hypothetical protein
MVDKIGNGRKIKAKVKGKREKAKKEVFYHEETKRHEERGLLTLIDRR